MLQMLNSYITENDDQKIRDPIQDLLEGKNY